jgi:hypothetical protein
MALTDGALNAMLDAFAGVAGYVSLHTGNPSTTGANEVTGGSYAREVAPWDSASAGTVTTDASIVFDVPADTTIQFIGYWSADTAGTFYGSRALNENQTFATAGTYTIAAGNLSESLT